MEKTLPYHITPDLVKLPCTTLQIFIFSCNELQESAVNLTETRPNCRENGGPLKLAALCGRIARVVQRPALHAGRIWGLRMATEIFQHNLSAIF